MSGIFGILYSGIPPVNQLFLQTQGQFYQLAGWSSGQTDGTTSLGPNGITMGSTGVFQIAFYLTVQSNIDTPITFYVYRNGVQIGDAFTITSFVYGGDYRSIAISTIANLSSGDEIDIRAASTLVPNVTLNFSAGHFQVNDFSAGVQGVTGPQGPTGAPGPAGTGGGSSGGAAAPSGAGLVTATGGVLGVVSPGPTGAVLTSTGLGQDYEFIQRTSLGPIRFIDPANSSGFASDLNDGSSPSSPIRTTSHLNSLLFMRRLTADTTIKYMSDDSDVTGLDYSSLDFAGFNLTFQGTTTTLHTGGLIATGTVAINPATNQRQVLKVSDIAGPNGFGPYIVPALGATGALGTASYPSLLVDTNAGVSGTSSWIVSRTGLSSGANVSRPCDPTFAGPGTITVGDSYLIQRGNLLSLSPSAGFVNTGAPGSAATVTFNDFAFQSDSVGNTVASIYNRCSFNGPILVGGTFNHCFAGSNILIDGLVQGPFLSAGVLVIQDGTSSECIGVQLGLTGDVYITGGGPFILGNLYNQNVAIFSDTLGVGIQVHDMTSALGAILVFSSEVINFDADATNPLIWGTGNVGPGITIAPGATLQVGGKVGITPTITGVAGDFSFLSQQSDALSFSGRSWDETGNKYNEPSATTWANYVNSSVFNFQVHSVATNAAIVGTPSTFNVGPVGPSRQALGPVRFIDPANSSGLASDLNDGSDDTHPILTTAHLNSLLFNRRLTSDTVITYMSDDAGSVGLDYSTLDCGNFGLAFQGTPQVQHTGGTLNSGTVTISQLANQRQLVHTSDLADFTPYVSPGPPSGGAPWLLGAGTAPFPCYVIINTGPRDGNSGWIVNMNNATNTLSTPSISAPVLSDNSSAGFFNIGDSYKIQRGSTLSQAVQPISVGSGSISFTDFAFPDNGFGVSTGPNNNTYSRCSFNGGVNMGGTYNHCFLNGGIIEELPMGQISVNSGVSIVTTLNVCTSSLFLSNDVFFTGFGLLLGGDWYDNVFISAGNPGASPTGFKGVQIHDNSRPDSGAFVAYDNAPLDVSDVLVWGNGNLGVGMLVYPGATITAVGNTGFVPSVTGTGTFSLGGTATYPRDFAFVGQFGATGILQAARAWNDAVGAYTEAGTGPSRPCTWRHFVNPVAGASGMTGFSYQAHNPATNSSVVGIIF